MQSVSVCGKMRNGKVPLEILRAVESLVLRTVERGTEEIKRMKKSKLQQAQTSLLDEIIVDNFAGGGGASTGIELATGRPVAIAINHDPDAILMHKTNHPYTTHYQESVWDIDPREVCAGRPVGLAWFSPDCKHFSKAKGGKPVSRNIRGLAWIVLKWARCARPACDG